MISFDFRGLNSYEDFGILIERVPPIPLPQRTVTYNKVPGRNGSLTIDEGTYEDITLSISCYFEDREFEEKSQEIKAWLMGSPDKLILSNEDDKYYIAQVVNKMDIAQTIDTLGEFTLIFNCKPLKYSTNTDLIVLTLPGVISNIGTLPSKPIFKIFGTGNVAVTIGHQLFSINNLVGYVVVDSEMMDCYKDTQLKNNDMVGDFPLFSLGDNQVSWSGNITKIEIQPNWCWV